MSKEGETRERVYDFIVAFKTEHQGSTPTVRRITEGCGLSSTSVTQHHIKKLIDDGRITRTGRNIEVPGAVWMLAGEG